MANDPENVIQVEFFNLDFPVSIPGLEPVPRPSSEERWDKLTVRFDDQVGAITRLVARHEKTQARVERALALHAKTPRPLQFLVAWYMDLVDHGTCAPHTAASLMLRELQRVRREKLPFSFERTGGVFSMGSRDELFEFIEKVKRANRVQIFVFPGDMPLDEDPDWLSPVLYSMI